MGSVALCGIMGNATWESAPRLHIRDPIGARRIVAWGGPRRVCQRLLSYRLNDLINRQCGKRHAVFVEIIYEELALPRQLHLLTSRP